MNATAPETPISDSNGTIKLADYVLTRLRQLSVRSIFGVPGDYNLRLLDFIEPSGLHWVGNCNELNAAYAADAYARINVLSALITTFGVGELSAINGVANAYAEHAPVVHIVGTPARDLQDSHVSMHHTCADGDYGRFADMAARVTVAQTNLNDPGTAPQEIDRVIRQALIQSRPVYIGLPEDMVDVLVSIGSLYTTSLVETRIPPAMDFEKVVTQVLQRIHGAKRPMIFVDGECRSPAMFSHIDNLIRTTGWPTWTTIFGKGLVNETLDNVYGIFTRTFGPNEWSDYFDSADLVIMFGPHLSDTNTYNFTTIPQKEVSIQLSSNHSRSVKIGEDTYYDIPIPLLLSRVLAELDSTKLAQIGGLHKQTTPSPQLDLRNDITQEHFYAYINPILRAGDTVLTETGTAAHGGRGMSLPEGVRLFTAVTWLSIGYMLPATLGVSLAKRDLLAYNNRSDDATAANTSGLSATRGPRSVLLIGDGSLQMTAQELSVMIKEELDILVFIINNGGYTIERVIHGRKQGYNDVPCWRHEYLLLAFGADEEHAAKSYRATSTWGELREVLSDQWILYGHGLRIIEVFMNAEDVQLSGPLGSLLKRQIEEEERQKQ